MHCGMQNADASRIDELTVANRALEEQVSRLSADLDAARKASATTNKKLKKANKQQRELETEMADLQVELQRQKEIAAVSEAVPPGSRKSGTAAAAAAADDSGAEEFGESSEESDEEPAAPALGKWKAGTKIDVDTEDGIEYGAVVLGPSRKRNPKLRRIRFADGVEDDWPVSDFRKPYKVGKRDDSGTPVAARKPEDQIGNGPPEAVLPKKVFIAQQETGGQAKVGKVNRKVRITVSGAGLLVTEDKAAWPKELGRYSFTAMVAWDMRPKRKDVVEVRTLIASSVRGAPSDASGNMLATQVKVQNEGPQCFVLKQAQELVRSLQAAKMGASGHVDPCFLAKARACD